MYVITDHEGVILHLSKTIGYQENGNVLVDHGTLAIAAHLVGAVSADMDIPAGVREGTHVYLDGAFAENPDYVPPQPMENERLSTLEAIVDDLLVAALETGVRG